MQFAIAKVTPATMVNTDKLLTPSHDKKGFYCTQPCKGKALFEDKMLCDGGIHHAAYWISTASKH